MLTVFDFESLAVRIEYLHRVEAVAGGLVTKAALYTRVFRFLSNLQGLGKLLVGGLPPVDRVDVVPERIDKLYVCRAKLA